VGVWEEGVREEEAQGVGALEVHPQEEALEAAPEEAARELRSKALEEVLVEILALDLLQHYQTEALPLMEETNLHRII